MRTEFLTTIINKDNEEQVEKLKQLEQFDIEEASNESDKESTELEKSPPVKAHNLQKKYKEAVPSQESFPNISLQRKRDGRIKEASFSPFHDKYMKNLDEYYNNLEGHSYHNNSSNMRSLLSQNIYSNRDEENTPEPIHVASQNKLQSYARRNNEYDLSVDINDIIKKSLQPNKLMTSAGRGIKRKAMNIKIGNKQTIHLTPSVHRKQNIINGT